MNDSVVSSSTTHYHVKPTSTTSLGLPTYIYETSPASAPALELSGTHIQNTDSLQIQTQNPPVQDCVLTITAVLHLYYCMLILSIAVLLIVVV